MSSAEFPIGTTRVRAPSHFGRILLLMLLGSGGDLMASSPAPAAQSDLAADRRICAVVVSVDTYARQEWRAVVDALVAKHRAEVIRYETDVNEAVWALSAWMPDRICFVARPEEAGREYVIRIHHLTRQLDADPYTDAIWGIVTGYDAGDALRIARRSEPLVIRRGASGAGVGHIESLPDGFASSESSKNDFWIRRDGKTTRSRVEPDASRSLAEGFNTMAPEIFFTSGHATERDWEVGYNFRGGQFLCEQGRLYARTSNGERVDIHSPNVKVYLPMGNCLIGRIPQPDCMATAWMHSGGVHQMFGYTVVTWFGYVGWGTGQYFSGGRNNLAESFFFTEQALLHKLHTEYPRWANTELYNFEPNVIHELFTRHGLLKEEGGRIVPEQTAAGLLWDRDTVAFYGDPGWDARMSRLEPGWQQAFSEGDGRTTFRITATREGSWPEKPVIAWLPSRLANVRLTDPPHPKAVVTDNFLLLTMSGAFGKGDTIEISFSGTPMVRPDRQSLGQLQLAATQVRSLAGPSRPGVIAALGRAGNHRGVLLEALRATQDDRREGMAFLLANMPDNDLRAIDPGVLRESVELAYEAREKAPWAHEVPAELFLNDILPYASLDETRDPWRKEFRGRFAGKAWEFRTIEEAVRFLNREVFRVYGVQYDAAKRPKPNTSPAETIKAGCASCTGLSIMLVDACRACGIPARIASIPAWKDGKGDAAGRHAGNHTWVEVWAGRWRHVGGAEDTELDKGWFTGKTRGNAVDPRLWPHRIYASSFRRTGLSFPLVWSLETTWVPAVDVTEAYQKPEAASQPVGR
ncbi:MAG TPA: transglutaminase-like domain-containing protein [Phycisphaerae bacterium]|nr:transglutaminase-like domain-containing protein [Phycisphaerae bacterium]HRY70533.1 transglutaminase-like domain-containing protein [Phycisphaerae bacterium]HSA27981.1 transglutaminase-like domain-containing protein [Phycisphaerae bacterium]